MSTTTPKSMPLEDFIEDYIQGEPLTIDTVKWAIRKYIYMNYTPTLKDKLQLYEFLLFEIARLLEGNQPSEIQKLLTNIKSWAYARQNSVEEQNEFEKLAIENETFYNLIKH
jgi:hypothetical protein